MNFAVFELPKAKSDKHFIFEWLYEHSRPGAAAWLNAYDACIKRLELHADSFRAALENDGLKLDGLKLDVKQAFFKTRRGRVYRMLFHIEENNVYVLRVRGPGQAPIEPSDI